jgi:hypothetical protein
VALAVSTVSVHAGSGVIAAVEIVALELLIVTEFEVVAEPAVVPSVGVTTQVTAWLREKYVPDRVGSVPPTVAPPTFHTIPYVTVSPSTSVAVAGVQVMVLVS